jgi:hypothetical protein
MNTMRGMPPALFAVWMVVIGVFGVIVLAYILKDGFETAAAAERLQQRGGRVTGRVTAVDEDPGHDDRSTFWFTIRYATPDGEREFKDSALSRRWRVGDEVPVLFDGYGAMTEADANPVMHRSIAVIVVALVAAFAVFIAVLMLR